jgi:hypothetical protein
MSKHKPSKATDLSAPNIVKRKVFVRRKNSDYRNREYLTEKEVNAVISAASKVVLNSVQN